MRTTSSIWATYASSLSARLGKRPIVWRYMPPVLA